MMNRTYIAIDLKSFYASVECVDRHLDPLDTNLVVADERRGNGTICLAVSAALKSFGVPGRPHLFEARQKVAELNAERGRPGVRSQSASQLRADPSLAVDFYIARPRMARYIEYSARIYGIYLEFVDSADIHVYSIDEVFIDATPYLRMYRMSGTELAITIVKRIIERTGITATAGIGTNLFLAKVAMDIKAKHMEADSHGVRVAELDEMSFRREMWPHTPMTDFWRIGGGTAATLTRMGLHTMGDVARCSLKNAGWLYRIFGVNAELLIDHAWGREPVTIADIKAYSPAEHSLQTGQVLPSPYSTEKARIVVMEMANSLCLDMVSKGLATDRVSLWLSYEHKDRTHPHKSSHGSVQLGETTASCRLIAHSVLEIFDSIADRSRMIRRIGICAERVKAQPILTPIRTEGLQLNLFADSSAQIEAWRKVRMSRVRELSRQKAIVEIMRRFGKNAILRGINFCDGATQRIRNTQIGGHSA